MNNILYIQLKIYFSNQRNKYLIYIDYEETFNKIMMVSIFGHMKMFLEKIIVTQTSPNQFFCLPIVFLSCHDKLDFEHIKNGFQTTLDPFNIRWSYYLKATGTFI